MAALKLLASPLFLGPSVSFPRTTVRTKHARSYCSVSFLGDFSAFFLIRHQTRVVFVAFLGSRQFRRKTSGGLVWGFGEAIISV